MERLTTKHAGINEIKGFLNVSCDDICINHLCEKCPIQKAFDKLSEYEDAEEQGLLLRLPCKFGDAVFVIRYGEENNFEIFKTKICEIQMNTNGLFFKTVLAVPGFQLKDFGKTVFLTREEAEKALERMV